MTQRSIVIFDLGGVLIDDSRPNAAAADGLGLRGLVFTSSERLKADLTGLGLL